jgi:hypothetical protein
MVCVTLIRVRRLVNTVGCPRKWVFVISRKSVFFGNYFLFLQNSEDFDRTSCAKVLQCEGHGHNLNLQRHGHEHRHGHGHRCMSHIFKMRIFPPSLSLWRG